MFGWYPLFWRLGKQTAGRFRWLCNWVRCVCLRGGVDPGLPLCHLELVESSRHILEERLDFLDVLLLMEDGRRVLSCLMFLHAPLLGSLSYCFGKVESENIEQVNTGGKLCESKMHEHAREQPPAGSPPTVFPDWASYQAYYNSAGTPPFPPPGFFHSPVASSPQAHPYMWGQHIFPPYGTPPPPYVTMYPHGGLYAHPSIPPGSHPYSPYAMPLPNGTVEPSVAAAGGGDIEGKSGESKSRSPLKRSKGSLGSLSMLTGKNNEMGKASGASANGGLSQSGESMSEGSSEGSDANSQNGSQQKPCGEQGSVDTVAQNGSTGFSVSSGVARTPPIQAMLNQSMVMSIPPNSVSGPTTNLNIGMDYWGGSAPSPITTAQGKLPSVPAATIVPSSLVGSRDGVPSDVWIQDERELKRQRRKQSNRESARRSRLRKQSECEELAQRVGTLKEENRSLREELERMREECEKLASENASLTEKFHKHQGQDSTVDGINGHPDSDPHTVSNMPRQGDC
ncbi:hypothetical protein HHK36_024208 [Tetracentron sinense]|uniref:BZIP domain-containing protein n=1 Tax=Tetracentron sinense TaxID=13715 RepID=A0A835D7A3_TETSI|nr:hypothetical protein HHK36_024208 [Tetracentron sinense]